MMAVLMMAVLMMALPAVIIFSAFATTLRLCCFPRSLSRFATALGAALWQSGPAQLGTAHFVETVVHLQSPACPASRRCHVGPAPALGPWRWPLLRARSVHLIEMRCLAVAVLNAVEKRAWRTVFSICRKRLAISGATLWPMSQQRPTAGKMASSPG